MRAVSGELDVVERDEKGLGLLFGDHFARAYGSVARHRCEHAIDRVVERSLCGARELGEKRSRTSCRGGACFKACGTPSTASVVGPTPRTSRPKASTSFACSSRSATSDSTDLDRFGQEQTLHCGRSAFVRTSQAVERNAFGGGMLIEHEEPVGPFTDEERRTHLPHESQRSVL